MYIPDLFGAYIKGRELAIAKNWQDLKNYEAVEDARNKNDLQALQILGNRADFGGNRSMFRDRVDQSKRANEVAEYMQPGLDARADLGSMFAQDQRGVYLNSRPTVQQVMQQMFDANLGKQSAAAGVQRSTNAYWTPERQYNAGQDRGRVGYNTYAANGVAAMDYVPAAQRQIAQNHANYGVNMAADQYRLGELNNSIANQDAQHELGRTRIKNTQWQQDNFIGQQLAAQQDAQQTAREQALRELTTYRQKAQAGDPAAAAMVKYLEQQYNLGQFVQPLQAPAQTSANVKPLIPTPLQQTDANQAAELNFLTEAQRQLGAISPYPVIPEYPQPLHYSRYQQTVPTYYPGSSYPSIGR